MGHKLGFHWQKAHFQQDVDLDHISKMGYLSYTLFGDGGWDNKDFCNALLPVTIPSAIFLPRDHGMSEEKEACESDPAGTGTAHGIRWGKRVQEGKVHLPIDRCYFLGINEMDTNKFQRQNDVYTTHFAKSLANYGLKCAGWSFGVGHPSTKDLDPKKPPDWSHYRESAETLLRLGGIAAIHEYWLPGNYNWGNWLGRYVEHCPFDVPFVIKESFYDSGLENRFPNQGYMWYIDEGDPAQVSHFLAEINGAQSRMSKDSRFHSLQGFNYDSAKPWGSFDIKPIRKYFEAFPWTTASEQEKTRLPVVGNGKGQQGGAELGSPISGPSDITQRFGENPADYARFGAPGHNGVDYGPRTVGAYAIATAEGEVQFTGNDVDYGNYVRVFHPQLGFHSFYAHLERIDVKPGQFVKRATPLGVVGTTGNSSGIHLHLEIRLANPDGSYKEGQSGYGKGRVDPQTVMEVLNGA